MLYINDLPLASEFDTTLYADDTALMLSDRDLNSLKYKANNELKKVDFWLRMNKLSLNYFKTNYIIYNNQSHKTCKDEFTIVMNKTRLQRENSIKYLGVIFDDKLCWANHMTIYLVNLPDALVCSVDCAIMFREKLFACSIIT